MTISARFTKVVREHLVLSLVNFPVHPVIMGVFGPPGEGKSYQLRTILSDLAVNTRSISAADFESERAGVPGKDLLETYVSASRAVGRKEPTCIVIDDIDTTVGEWENNTGTVNHQQVLAQLMHLADRPCILEKIGLVDRVPIFVTGNDLSKLYPPLRRPGRMTVLHWAPTLEERKEIVTHVLAGLADSKLVMHLLASYPRHPISFFAELRSLLVRSASAATICRLADNLSLICGEPDRYRAHIEVGVHDILDPLLVEQIAAGLHEQHVVANRSYLAPHYLISPPGQVIE